MDLDVLFERELTPADLVASPKPKSVSPILKLRASHHALAKCLAAGKGPTEASRITGYSVERVTQLKKSPAFLELIEHYTDAVEEILSDVQAQIRDFGLDALDELRERLQTDPKQFKIPDLVEIQKLVLDRTGHGPKSSVNQNVRVAVLSDTTLERIKTEAESRRLGAVRLLSGPEGTIDSFPVRSSAPREEQASAPRSEGEGADIREEIREDAKAEPPLRSVLPIPVD